MSFFIFQPQVTLMHFELLCCISYFSPKLRWCMESCYAVYHSSAPSYVDAFRVVMSYFIFQQQVTLMHVELLCRISYFSPKLRWCISNCYVVFHISAASYVNAWRFVMSYNRISYFSPKLNWCMESCYCVFYTSAPSYVDAFRVVMLYFIFQSQVTLMHFELLCRISYFNPKLRWCMESCNAVYNLSYFSPKLRWCVWSCYVVIHISAPSYVDAFRVIMLYFIFQPQVTLMRFELLCCISYFSPK